jgi:3-hydroxyisobutyrate dehydrogenase-like beta-hydroxyacid dehydrogenase
MMAIKTVGYIGLGHAGFLMATNLHRAGFHMIVRDADPEREQRFAKENANARVASEDTNAFRDADVIITMLPQGKVVREVMLGQKGYARGLKAGICSIQYSYAVLRVTGSYVVQALSSSTRRRRRHSTPVVWAPK